MKRTRQSKIAQSRTQSRPSRDIRKGQKGNRYERTMNSQGDGSVVSDVHILSHSEPILTLDVAEYDKGGAATTVET